MSAPVRHLRPVEPPAVDGPRGVVGARPEPLLVRPRDCRIDPAYQREISGRGAKLIARLVAAWDWDLYDPIKVAETPDGLWEVPDGQHRVAAAILLNISQLPAMRVCAPDRAARARLFVSLNEGRVAVTPLQRWRAACAAGESEAIAIRDAAAEAGVAIRTNAGAADAAATSSIGGLHRLRAAAGDAGLLSALRACAAAGLRPVGADHLAALAELHAEPGWRDAPEAAVAAALRQWEAVKDAADVEALDTGQPKARSRARQLWALATA